MRAADIMQKGIVSVSPDLSVADLEELLTGEDIGGAPVTSEDGALLGMASKTDIVRALGEQAGGLQELLGPQLRVADIMTPGVIQVGPDDDVRSVARRMLDAQIHRVVVVRGDEVLGIVSTLDVLRALC